MNVCPATAIVPLRDKPEFDEALKVIVLPPLKGFPLVTEIQLSLLETEKSQFGGAVTSNEKVPPVKETFCEVAESV